MTAEAKAKQNAAHCRRLLFRCDTGLRCCEKIQRSRTPGSACSLRERMKATFANLRLVLIDSFRSVTSSMLGDDSLVRIRRKMQLEARFEGIGFLLLKRLKIPRARYGRLNYLLHATRGEVVRGGRSSEKLNSVETEIGQGSVSKFRARRVNRSTRLF